MDEKLPQYAGYRILLEARDKELKVITTELSKCKHGSRAFQQIPRHMQRRQVSSHPKRLPRSIREKNRKEIGDIIKERKRPCRKYRRRPKNLLLEYAHRQKGTAWLETHIWHAKRFHMIKQWNYAIPHSPTASGYRSTIRAIRESCLVQDTSYDTCLQLDGNRENLFHGLCPLLSKEDQQIVFEANSSHLEDWHEIMLHQANKFPLGRIGGVRLYWHPTETNDRNNSLWIWVHPSILQEVISAFVFSFDMTPVLPKQNSFSLNESTTKDVTNNMYSPSFISNFGVKLYNLKGSLNKFSLFGPKAAKILQEVLNPISLNTTESEQMEEDPKEKFWWKKYFSNEDNLAANDYQVNLWNNTNIKLPIRKTIFGFVVRDIRLILPAKKISFQNLNKDNEKEIKQVESSRKVSYPILNRAIREKVSSSMPSNDEVNKIRSSRLIPGSNIDVTEEESRVPVLIFFNPGIGKNPSWDLVLPRGWAKETWVALHYHGAVAGGFQQELILFTECLITKKPYLFPDSLAGKSYSLFRCRQLESEYFKRPPKARPNFICLGTQHPFQSPWMRLVNSWCKNVTDYYVQRDHSQLDLYKSWLKVKNNKRIKLDNEISEPREFLNDESCLIEVRLITLSKGNIEPFAMICMPRMEDLQCVGENFKNFIWKNLDEIKETRHKDPNVEIRRQLKESHIKLKLKLKKVRRKVKNSQVPSESSPLIEHSTTQDDTYKKAYNEMEGYEKTSKDLWLVNKNDELQMCSRKIMGYIEWGDFSVFTGRCSGRGFVVAKALREFRQQNDTELLYQFVLIRNPTSLDYIWTRLEIM